MILTVNYLELVKFVINQYSQIVDFSKHINRWNSGLEGACIGGHQEIANLIISMGANRCWYCNNTKHKF